MKAVSNHLLIKGRFAMNTQSIYQGRRYDLDWLRVCAILAVFVYHCSLVFGTDPSSIKNPTTYPLVNDLSDSAALWGMPMIFIISGASVFLALGKNSPGRYLKGIVLRLLVPLIFGTFTHIAFQVYLENLHKGTFSGSFFDFYPHYFDGMYGFGGNFAWMGMHLWYLEALFIFSILCLPLYWWLKKRSSGQYLLKRLGDFLGKSGAIYLLALPAIILFNILNPDSWGTTVMGGWSIFNYLVFFISGFVIISNERLQLSIKNMRWISLGIAIITWLTFDFIWEALGDPSYGSWQYFIGTAIWCLSAWCWLHTIFGFAFRHLRQTNHFLSYANEATLPFYILHQTVIFSIAYYVVGWNIPDLLKWVLILIPSFAISIGVYESLVRRFNPMRILFGMKPLARPPKVSSQELQTVVLPSISHE
jgi:peptidoglycan/LPS O-acetylase OafA/YrhL